jgi:hypothetical protein
VLYLGSIRLIDIIELEGIRVAMAAKNLVVLIFLRLFGLPADTKSTNIVLTTVRDENVIEIS